jgi:hypothetical protein
VAIEIGYKEMNASMEWIKYSVCTLIKSDCYISIIGRPESQVVLFLLGWSSDLDGMYCMLVLFQDAPAWGNKSCWMLPLLFPEVRGPVSQPPRTVKPLAPDINYTSCVTKQGGQLTNVENLMGCGESRSLNSLTNQSTL